MFIIIDYLFLFSVANTSQTTKKISVPMQRLTNPHNFTTIAPIMKPNIFKIVPENMQTKPQIVTFSTLTVASTTTTITTTSSTSSSHKAPLIIKQNTLPYKPLQKPNGSATKNVVFHKEGKVYIIDPLQNKLKQQKKKQVSLLKPQVSLLKQQLLQQQIQDNPSVPKMSIKAEDHDYLSTPKTGPLNNAPQVHFGLKQQRINSFNILQLMQMKRILFEKQILRQEFVNMQSAVEFILRRLKLIAPKESLVSAFPFVSQTNKEFQSLTAFKQRTNEWLRAKHISRLIRNHKDLQNVSNKSRETFWSTKEIATFARQYAYTPDIKSLPRFMDKLETDCRNFKELVKVELKQKETATFETITDCHSILKWLDKVLPILKDFKNCEIQYQIIDVVENIQKDVCKSSHRSSHLTSLSDPCSNNIYLPTPDYLENECNFVSKICNDLSLNLMPEELTPKIFHPSVVTILAHCLNIFLQKIIRKSICLKHQENSATIEPMYTIEPADIAKVLSQSVEFDFLTNNNFGTTSRYDNVLKTSVKQEKKS